jgi:phage replication O-like protein O
MARPQIEDGYLKLSNELAEALARYRLTGEQTSIIWCILRLTYGYSKKACPIQITTFAKMTGLRPPNVIRAIEKLKKMKVVLVEDDQNFIRIKKYAIQKDYEAWEGWGVITGDNEIITGDNKKEIKKLSRARTEIITGDNSCYHGREVTPIIEKKVKENIKQPENGDGEKKKKKSKKVEYPPWLDMELWREFKRHRSRIKAPMTRFAEDRMLSKLQSLCDGKMERHREFLEQSITNGWKGIFQLRDDTTEKTWKPEHRR